MRKECVENVFVSLCIIIEEMSLYCKLISFINNQDSIVHSTGSKIMKNIFKLKSRMCIKF